MTSKRNERNTVNRLSLVLVALSTIVALGPPSARAATPAAICARIGSDDVVHRYRKALCPQSIGCSARRCQPVWR